MPEAGSLKVPKLNKLRIQITVGKHPELYTKINHERSGNTQNSTEDQLRCRAVTLVLISNDFSELTRQVRQPMIASDYHCQF
jgi:hypothetical protein